MYNVQGMTDKNKDSLLKDILDLVDSSANSYLQKLFPDRPDPNSKKRPPLPVTASRLAPTLWSRTS